MKKLTIAALFAGQMLAAAPPVFAADFASTENSRAGTFAGFRMRVALDGDPRETRQVRAGLTLAPTLHSRNAEGATRLRFGEGLELGISGREPVRLSLAGMPVSRLAEGPVGPDGRRLGVSTVGWIAIGAGVVVLGVAGFYVWLLEASECGPREC